MKNWKSLIGMLLAVALVSGTAEARTHHRRKKVVDEEDQSTTQVRETSSSPEMHFGAGFTTFGVGNGSLSGILELPEYKSSIQAFFGIGGTSPFTMGAGALYRYTLVGTMATGLHIGAGFELGAANTGAGAITGTSVAAGNAFAANFPLIAGFHFPVADKIQVSLDGGSQFQVVSSTFQYTMAPLAALVGLSIHYLF